MVLTEVLTVLCARLMPTTKSFRKLSQTRRCCTVRKGNASGKTPRLSLTLSSLENHSHKSSLNCSWEPEKLRFKVATFWLLWVLHLLCSLSISCQVAFQRSALKCWWTWWTPKKQVATILLRKNNASCLFAENATKQLPNFVKMLAGLKTSKKFCHLIIKEKKFHQSCDRILLLLNN